MSEKRKPLSDKDFQDTCALVSLIGTVASNAIDDNMSIDVLIDSVATVLGAVICQKHKIEVRCPGSTTTQIVEAATKLILDNKKPDTTVPTPSNN